LETESNIAYKLTSLAGGGQSGACTNVETL
jgi:hypothetical protein